MKNKYRFTVDNSFSLVVESNPLNKWKVWLILRLTGWQTIKLHTENYSPYKKPESK